MPNLRRIPGGLNVEEIIELDIEAVDFRRRYLGIFFKQTKIMIAMLENIDRTDMDFWRETLEFVEAEIAGLKRKMLKSDVELKNEYMILKEDCPRLLGYEWISE